MAASIQENKRDSAQLRTQTAEYETPAENEKTVPEGQARRSDRVPIAQAQATGIDRAAFDERWHCVQMAFVDDPRAAVAEADALLQEASLRFVEALNAQRDYLAAKWSDGEEASTEDLRTCVQAYRGMLRRLLDA